MKTHVLSLIGFFFSFFAYCQNNEITIEFISDNVFEVSESTLNKIESLQLLEWTGFDSFQVHDVNFDGDDKQDLICKIAGNAEISFIVSIFEWDDEKQKFIENSNYMMNPFGEVHMRQKNVYDFNNDGLMDVYIPVENYHGRDGFKPDYYLSDYSLYYPAQVYFNNGQTFDKIIVDTLTTQNYKDGNEYRDYIPFDHAGFGDINLNGNIEIIRPDRSKNPENKQHLFSVYSWGGNKFNKEKFIHIGHPDEIVSSGENDITLGNHIKFNGTILNILLERRYMSSSGFMFGDPEFWKFDLSSGSPEIFSKVSLIRDETIVGAGNMLDNQHEFLVDLNLDGIDEIVIGMSKIPNDNKHFGVHVFNSVTGNEVTRDWFDNDFLESYTNGTNGDGLHIQLVDLNSDGLFDVFSHDPLERGSQQIVFFMNTGQNFEKYLFNLETNGWNFPVDVDGDGEYEFLHFYSIPRGQWEDPNINPLSLNNSAKLYNINFDQFGNELKNNSTKKNHMPKIFPNPTSDILTIDSNKNYEIEIYDYSGKKILSESGRVINISMLSTGNYLIKLVDPNDKNEFIFKVLKD